MNQVMVRDMLVSIDGTSVEDLDDDTVAGLLTGHAGTKVRLLNRPPKPKRSQRDQVCRLFVRLRAELSVP